MADPTPSSLLQLMDNGADGAGRNPWAPEWVYQQLPTELAAWRAANSDGGGGGSPFASMPTGRPSTPEEVLSQVGKLAPYYNPDNWGPAPAEATGSTGGGGWFPGFNDLAPGIDRKYWSMKSAGKAYNQQHPSDTFDPRALDEQPNIRSGASGFMYLGHPISLDKLSYDTHRPVDTQEGAGVPGGSFLPYRGFGTQGTGWSTKGQVGYPGQLDPFAQIWGAGGP